MATLTPKTKKFDTKTSVAKARRLSKAPKKWVLRANGQNYSWSNKMERIEVIRLGIPFTAIEALSEKLNRPIKFILSQVGIPQTTYNKKKNEAALLDSGTAELLVLLTELIDHGQDVFNGEDEKFQRWLTKPNLSLGGVTPESLFDTATGIDEVNACLNRIEYGILA